jgi:hypothetical protein
LGDFGDVWFASHSMMQGDGVPLPCRGEAGVANPSRWDCPLVLFHI